MLSNYDLNVSYSTVYSGLLTSFVSPSGHGNRCLLNLSAPYIITVWDVGDLYHCIRSSINLSEWPQTKGWRRRLTARSVTGNGIPVCWLEGNSHLQTAIVASVRQCEFGTKQTCLRSSYIAEFGKYIKWHKSVTMVSLRTTVTGASCELIIVIILTVRVPTATAVTATHAIRTTEAAVSVTVIEQTALVTKSIEGYNFSNRDSSSNGSCDHPRQQR